MAIDWYLHKDMVLKPSEKLLLEEIHNVPKNQKAKVYPSNKPEIYTLREKGLITTKKSGNNTLRVIFTVKSYDRFVTHDRPGGTIDINLLSNEIKN